MQAAWQSATRFNRQFSWKPSEPAGDLILENQPILTSFDWLVLTGFY
jgi:hypothetical protein